jgi:hypothetical protein
MPKLERAFAKIHRSVRQMDDCEATLETFKRVEFIRFLAHFHGLGDAY